MFGKLKLGLLACAAGLLTAVGTTNAATEIQGAGSTFVAPIMAKWIQVYNAEHPNEKIDYQAIGSGGGIQGITDRTIQFAGSDAPMTNAQMTGAPAKVLHFPELAGPVTMIYNVPGVPSNEHIVMDGRVIADIYLGRIRHWDNAEIKALNPSLSLPHLRVLVAHRSEGSGTTYIFTGYLCAVSHAWKSHVGQSTSVRWPTGRGGKGSDGVAAIVKNTKGGFGYDEYAYALTNHLTYALLKNRSGHIVKPSIGGVVVAQAAIVKHLPADFRLPIINPPSKKAYPIGGFTYLIIYQDLSYMKSRTEALDTVKFLHWVLTKGQRYAKGLEYARLPSNMQKKLLAQLDTVTYNGSPLLK